MCDRNNETFFSSTKITLYHIFAFVFMLLHLIQMAYTCIFIFKLVHVLANQKQ